MPPVPGSLRSLQGSAMHDLLGLGRGVDRGVGDRQPRGERRGRERRGQAPRRAPRSHRARQRRRPRQQRERAGDHERDAEGVADGADEHVVGALGERGRTSRAPRRCSRCRCRRAPAAGRRAGVRASTPPSSAGASVSLSCGGSFASSTSATPCSCARSVTTSSRCAISGASAISTSAMPTWRIVSSRAASRVVRSGSSSPANAGSAIPIPTPASTCGANVQATDALGSHASASTPPPTSSAAGERTACAAAPWTREPAIARERQDGDRRRGRERLDRPAGDQQQHETEEHGGERGRRRGRARAASAIARRAASSFRAPPIGTDRLRATSPRAA